MHYIFKCNDNYHKSFVLPCARQIVTVKVTIFMTGSVLLNHALALTDYYKT